MLPRTLSTAGLLLVLLAGCADGYRLERRIRAVNQDSRIAFLVLHYTDSGNERSLAVLSQPGHQVSVHYLVPEREPGAAGPYPVYQLVPEEQRAWHAGISAWQGSRMLNASSIGIEIVNRGVDERDAALPLQQRRWQAYPPAQLQAVGALARDIIERHAIAPDRVLGHSDVAPGRKLDPGPAFPWEWLYRHHGLGAWPDTARVVHFRRHHPWDGDLLAVQHKLARYGYAIDPSGRADAQTRAVLTAFQLHFRPRRYDGEADVETVAILDALLEKYRRWAGLAALPVSPPAPIPSLSGYCRSPSAAAGPSGAPRVAPAPPDPRL